MNQDAKEVASADHSPESEACLADSKQDFLDVLIELSKFHEELSEMAGEHAVEMLENAQLLPPPDVIDRILRYQSAERRHLFRLLGELRQVQTERRGEVVPHALNAVGGA